MASLTPIKALFFDVFGTLVDFRGGVAREAERLLAPRGARLDWGAFADAWRAEYQPGMEVIRAGHEGYVRLDVVHRRNLDRILPRFGAGAPALRPPIQTTKPRDGYRDRINISISL